MDSLFDIMVVVVDGSKSGNARRGSIHPMNSDVSTAGSLLSILISAELPAHSNHQLDPSARR
jgi:hypothetical protein